VTGIGEGLGRVEDPGMVVQAAGGVIWRRAPAANPGLEVVLVHRPRYDDWTLPKGKLEPGETHEAAACREVEEEAGVRVLLGTELESTLYLDRSGRHKAVRYWSMTVAAGEVGGSNEVDSAEWVPLEVARSRLTYPRDRPVLDNAAVVLGPLGGLDVTGLDHVVIRSADVGASLAWWSVVLGLPEVRVAEWRRGEAPFPSVRVDDRTIIDLVPGEPSGVNVEHVCLVVRGVSPDVLSNHGRFDVVGGPSTVFGARGEGVSVYVRAPEGTVVELRTYPPETSP
jgi:8-oxo-dGTP diphosphatase